MPDPRYHIGMDEYRFDDRGLERAPNRIDLRLRGLLAVEGWSPELDLTVAVCLSDFRLCSNLDQTTGSALDPNLYGIQAHYSTYLGD